LGNTTQSDLGALHRFDSWTARTNYSSSETPRACREVRFVHDAAPISSIPAWRRLVNVDVVDPPGRERALSTLFQGTPFQYKRADDESDEHPPLRVGSPNINPATAANDQYTLSRVYPLPIQGDLPLDFELMIAPETAIGNIALWEENNETGIFSYSVRDLLLSPWFESWIGGVLS